MHWTAVSGRNDVRAGIKTGENTGCPTLDNESEAFVQEVIKAP